MLPFEPCRKERLYIMRELPRTRSPKMIKRKMKAARVSQYTTAGHGPGPWPGSRWLAHTGRRSMPRAAPHEKQKAFMSKIAARSRFMKELDSAKN
ncbi:hypothetical protein NDU88_001341 [Pleurodeles waltl]|uniref:Uncharacterized protein n=1 Tax=Pleurodeles waltl TaxID=8319 RepID=A0AAV7U6R7_PLEWA|nr:hypothetical protein NDU88_001341 [Pleurodeles waltl]